MSGSTSCWPTAKYKSWASSVAPKLAPKRAAAVSLPERAIDPQPIEPAAVPAPDEAPFAAPTTALIHEAAIARDRVEPSYDPRSLRAGEIQTVVLRVLVDEQGRAVRVVVEEGIPNEKLEASAINAVLRWSYRPARHNGEPLRGWATEKFVFRGRPKGK